MRLSILLLAACAVLSSPVKKTKENQGREIRVRRSIAQSKRPLRSDVFKLSREFALKDHTDCQGKTTRSRVTVKDPKDAYSISAQTLGQETMRSPHLIARPALTVGSKNAKRRTLGWKFKRTPVQAPDACMFSKDKRTSLITNFDVV